VQIKSVYGTKYGWRSVVNQEHKKIAEKT